VHTLWKLRLRAAIEKGGLLDGAKAGADDVCDLGRWLHNSAAKYKQVPEFQELTRCHTEFHQAAGRVVRLINEGKKVVALDDLEHGEFATSSSLVVAAINKLKNETAITVPPDTGDMPEAIEWRDLPQLGMDVMRRGRQEILRITTALHDVLSPDTIAVTHCDAVLGELARYLQNHFAVEEALMLQSSYPDYSHHKSEHELFLERIRQSQVNMGGGVASLTLDELNMLGDYLHHHVSEMDRALAQHLIKLRATMQLHIAAPGVKKVDTAP
jgi:hemerythrin-like metal-binding protein